jgi:hypothetical protein
MGSRRSRDSTRASPARSALLASLGSPYEANSQQGDKRQPVAASADLPVGMQDQIERERRRLRQASAVLSCLKIAALYQEWHEEIDPGDVAEIVQDLVDKALAGLDLVELARRAKAFERDAGASTSDD